MASRLEKLAESEEPESDTDNLTSLREVLLDEREVISDDDKPYTAIEANTYEEIIPASEIANEAAVEASQVSEKGINESCKVCLISIHFF